MNIITTTPNKLESATLRQINHVAAKGFGQNEDSESMLHDTIDHVSSAERVQLACDQEREDLIAFALYKGCLWRQGY